MKDEFGVEKAGHEAVLAAAMERVRADLARRAPGTRSVVLAHAFVTGGEPSDSERDITVGGVASVPAGVFDGVDYVALGHLHGCQSLTERVRYSGSPLPYSFSEAGHRKTMWLVDLGAGADLTAERIDCPVPGANCRPLCGARWRNCSPIPRWHGTRTRGSRRRSPTPCARPTRWPGYDGSRTRSASSSPPQRAPDDPDVSYARRLAGRSDQEIAEDFVKHVRGAEPDARERGVLRDAFDAVRADDTVREVAR